MTIKDKKECCYVIVGGNTKSIKQHSNIQNNIFPSLFSILLTLAILEMVSDQFVTASEVLPNESLFVEDNVTSSTNNLSENEGNKQIYFQRSTPICLVKRVSSLMLISLKLLMA